MEPDRIQENGWAQLEWILLGILMCDSQHGKELLRSVDAKNFQIEPVRAMVSEMQSRLEDKSQGLPDMAQYLYTAGCGDRERRHEQFDSVGRCIEMVLQRVSVNGEARRWLDSLVSAIGGTPSDFALLSNENKREIMDRFKRRESK